MLFFVMDVEAIGLHGRSFAVGYVVIDENGKELEADIACVSLDKLMLFPHRKEDYIWVKDNVVPHLPEPTHHYGHQLYTWFWDRWLKWKAEGALLAADVAWPVEANFLSRCVSEAKDGVDRNWEGPYPLIDISSVLFAKGFDSKKEFSRRENELPAHNPLNDARQSARILITILKGNYED